MQAYLEFYLLTIKWISKDSLQLTSFYIFGFIRPSSSIRNFFTLSVCLILEHSRYNVHISQKEFK